MYNKNKIASLLPRKLIYCDVGARWGIEGPWKQFRDIIELISFEPDREEYELLSEKKLPDDKIYPYALWREHKDVSLNLTQARGCSSIYEPNTEFLKLYPDAKRYNVDDVLKVKATSLDVLYEQNKIRNIDFIKIDVQGAELDVLKGGKKLLLENVLGVEVEVEFQPLYKNQPLFSDIDQFIRQSLGLQIYDLRKAYWKYREGINIGSNKGQLIFGDALYLRAPQDIIQWCAGFNSSVANEKILLACLIGLIYGYLDYGLCLLNQAQKKKIVSKSTIDKWESLLISYGRALKYNKAGARGLSYIFHILYRIFQRSYGGWSYSGHHLGSKKKFGVFY